jgi:hypothetical protein
LETLKATVRYGVLAFVMVGAVITLAGLNTDTPANESSSADKATPTTDFAKPEQDLITAELSSTG